MFPTTRKLCLVGEPGVGKTSLVRRLLQDADPLAEHAAAPQGITVARHRLALDAHSALEVTLWDLAGRSAIDTLNQAFLSGVDGVVAVADGTRESSIAVARQLLARVRDLYPDSPAILMLNKTDVRPLAPAGAPAADASEFAVSALTGKAVGDAFSALARRMAAREASHAQ